MRNLALTSLCLVSSSLLAQEQSPIKPLASAQLFEQFEQTQGGNWVVQWHPATGTPGTIYGTGLKINDWRKNSLEEGRRHANRLLVEQADMLGLGTSTFREVIGARMGRTWSFTFDQFFNNLPVIEGRVDVRINMRGVVAMMGSKAWPIPANFNTTPGIGQQVAQAAAWADLGGEPNGNAPAPRLVIWGDIASQQLAPFYLAWEVTVHEVGAGDTGKYGRYYVDAQTGRILHYQNDKHDCGFGGCKFKPTEKEVDGPSVTLIESPTVIESTAAPIPTTVTIMAWTRTGDDATSPLQNIPFEGLEVAVPGVGTEVTDEFGEFVIDINSPVTITINGLNGRHHNQISGGSAPTGSVTVQPGVNATIQLLSSGASSAQAAHTTSSYWTDRSNEWARSILGNTPQLATASNINITVNNNNTCNATYSSGSNTTTYYAQGGGCNNTAFSTVVAHEWGHGLDNRYGGIANSVAEGLSEGWGDIIGMYQVDSPILGSGFQTPGVGIRNGNNNRIWPYSSGVSPHGAGEVWMGWAWRFREALRASVGTAAAIQISDDIVLSSIVADATTRQAAVLEVFIADDDDGNLLNGTPHYSELADASIQKGIPYPEVPDMVPFGQGCESSIPTQAPSCPQLNPNGGTLSQDLRDNEYTHRVTNSGTIQVLSFECYAQSTGGNQTVAAHIYADNGGTPSSTPLASTTITIGTAQVFYTATFASPVTVSGDFYIGYETQAQNVYLCNLTSGVGGVAFYRDLVNGPTNWTQSALVDTPSWRVNCQAATTFQVPAIGIVGSPELGQTYLPQVTNAPSATPALLASGLSNTIFQGSPLPIALPGAPNCDLLVAADVVSLATTSVAGTASLPIAVPNQANLVGLELFHQWIIGDLAANSLGFITSDGGAVTLRN